LLQAEDYPSLKALAEMAADELRQAGMNVDVRSGDWGTVSTRRANRGPSPPPRSFDTSVSLAEVRRTAALVAGRGRARWRESLNVLRKISRPWDRHCRLDARKPFP
jgi:hypothetical protein